MVCKDLYIKTLLFLWPWADLQFFSVLIVRVSVEEEKRRQDEAADNLEQD